MAAESVNGEEFARLCARAVDDKKALDIVVMDLRGISSFTDFFVICSGSSEPHLKAISSSVRSLARELSVRRPRHEDGSPESQWVAVDFSDVIIHVFQQEMREFYDLESLWKDARLIDWKE